jgi:hypothetical protein
LQGDARESTVRECGDEHCGVRLVRQDDDVDIVREAWITVEAHGMTADDEVARLTSVQALQELSEVVAEGHAADNSAAARRP